MLATLLVVGCRSGCDAVAYNEIISMPEILAFDPAFDLLQQAVIEQVVETGESQARPSWCYNPAAAAAA